MVVITPPDMNDSRSRVVLGGIEYVIQFRYNFTGRYWSFGLYSSDEKPLLVGTKMVPCYPLNIFYGNKNMPDGVFGVISQKDVIDRDAFTSGDAKFVWIPRAELPKEAQVYG